MWLKQSTAVTVKIGPFVDEDDGKIAETGLTVSQADVRLSKNGGNMAQKNESSACTHDELGYYDCDLDTTDTGTLGRLKLMVHESGALPVWHDYLVVPSDVWDALFSSDGLNEIADAILKRDVANVEDAADADSLAALILARFHSAVSGTTWTIKKSDDATTFDTYTITKSSSADPITSVADPA